MREHLEKNNLYSKYQSAYMKFFYTEIAFVRVTDKWFAAQFGEDKKHIYVGLDLSAAFDTLNHDLILSIPETS